MDLRSDATTASPGDDQAISISETDRLILRGGPWRYPLPPFGSAEGQLADPARLDPLAACQERRVKQVLVVGAGRIGRMAG
ncbi:MAG: hypothetical protein ACO38P_04550, partial [Phycisphaerales bacterium]